MQPHFNSSKATLLAASMTPSQVQAGRPVFKLLWSQTPLYLVQECQLITNDPGHCHICIIPTTSTRLSDISFCVARPRVCNSLPSTLRQPDMDF